MHTLTIIFDLDGTLVDSAPDLHRAANVALATVGRAALDLPLITSFVGNGVETLMRRAVSQEGTASESTHQAALQAFLESYAANMTALTRPYPGVIECLGSLKAQGACLGICTNKPTDAALEVCRALELHDYFDVILGAKTGRPKKPDAAPLLDCAQRMNADPGRLIYVGDSAVDHATAQNAGVPFHFFTRGYLNGPPLDLAEGAQFDDWSNHGISPALLLR